MEQQYKPNSHKSKTEQKEAAERPKLDKIVSGGVKTKKKSGVSKFLGDFISEDAKDVKSYVSTDIVIPGIKRFLFDIITKGADIIFYGKAGGGSRRSTADRTSYAKFYDPRNDYGNARRADASPRFDFEDVIFDTRGDADAVLERMDETIATYGWVTVADYYDLCDITAPHTMNKYGWTNLSTASIEPARGGGYIIKLPRAVPIVK